MSLTIRSPKNFWAGFVYIVVGGGAALIATDYSMGTTTRMGPAYFPTMLGGCLVLVGLLSVIRSLSHSGKQVEPMAWRPVVFVSASLLLFAALLDGAGLVLALAALLIVAPFSSKLVKFSFAGTIAAVSLIAFCAVVFVQALGLPLHLVGTWFKG